MNHPIKNYSTVEAGIYDVDFHRRWFAELRNPDNEQTTSVLFRVGLSAQNREDGITTGMCCIGVACHIIDPSCWVENADGKLAIWVYDSYGAEEYADVAMPENIARDYGILGWLGMNLNDNGWTFAEIADAYEVMIP